MKKVRVLLVISVIIAFAVWSHDPIDDAANFIVGGLVPGTDIALGFWHTAGVVFLLMWLLKRSVTALRLQLLEHTAKQITAEKVKQEFAEQHSTTFDPKQRSVIAAPTSTSS